MSWPTGIETIKDLLAAENLQKVAPSLDAAAASLDAATRHIDSALLLAEHDADGAYTLLYDAARKSLPPRTVSSRDFAGCLLACQYCSAIFAATSTATEPESQKKTCSSPAGVISTSRRASRTAGSWVRPPNMTCAIRAS
jgi:hypothetical protein